MGDVELGGVGAGGVISETGKLIRKLNNMQQAKENKEELDK